MSKFKLTKKLNLDTYSQGSYLEFNLLTYKDIKKVAELDINQDTKDQNKIDKAITEVINILEDQFVSGKLPGEDDKLTEVSREDISTLPVIILTEAANFLSQSPTKG